MRALCFPLTYAPPPAAARTHCSHLTYSCLSVRAAGGKRGSVKFVDPEEDKPAPPPQDDDAHAPLLRGDSDVFEGGGFLNAEALRQHGGSKVTVIVNAMILVVTP